MRGQRTIRRVLASFCVLAASLALADEPQDEKTRAALSLEHGGKEVTAFTIRSTGGSGALFRLVKKPILRWSNPIRGSVFGDVYIWISKGRPEVVGSFLEWFEPIQSKEVELHSLSLEALKADRPDHLSWTTKRPGVELKPIPGAPQPAATPEKRLRQLRDLAKEFTARQIAHDGVEYEMRLLSQPLYRYENTEGDLIDGALYVFVHAGDPETFFLIEAQTRRRFPVGICPGPLQQRFSGRQAQGTRDLEGRTDRPMDQCPRSDGTVYRHHAWEAVTVTWCTFGGAFRLS